MIAVLEYVDETNKSPFADWFETLDATSAAKVTVALKRMELGNFSNVQGVGGGVFEYRLHSGPGLRVYFGRGDALVVLLGGGTKKRQQADIAKARGLWGEYRQRGKAAEEGTSLRYR